MSSDINPLGHLKAYDGSGNYIFVSYAHKDGLEVAPIVEHLLKHRYNVWFDVGITPGADWDEYLHKKVEGCSCFLCFISESSMSSPECRKEIVRARDAQRPFLGIFLEPTAIPPEIEDYVLRVQGIEKWRNPLDSESTFYGKLLSTDLFDGCKEYIEFDIQDNVLLRYNGTSTRVPVPEEATQIGYDAFEGNATITEVIIHKDVDRIGKFAFNDMPNLERIEVDPENGFFCSEDGILFNKARNYLLRYPPQRGGSEYAVPEGVENIGIIAFSGAADLKAAYIPKSVTMIGDRAFESCRNLVDVELLAAIDKIRPYTFSRCSELVNVQLPPTLNEIGDGAFSGCSNLLQIDIPKQVAYLGEMAFAHCTALKSVQMPAALDAIEEYCFNECHNLESIDLKQVRSIKQYAFKNCEALANIEFPPMLERIGRAAFSGCCSMKRLDLPDSVISIGAYSFDRCLLLEVTMCGKGLRKIDEGAFKDDISLRRVMIPRSIEQPLGKDAIPKNASIEYF